MKDRKLYYGTGYYDLYLPQSRAEEDLTLMQEAGFNLVRCGMSAWGDWEPEENKFDFTSLHRILSGAQSRGIRVIVSADTKSVPQWLTGKYPGGRIPTEEYRCYSTRYLRNLLEQCRPYSCVAGLEAGAGSTEENQYQTAILREYTAGSRFITCSVCTEPWAMDSAFAMAENADVTGCGVYHCGGIRNTGVELSMAGDLARSLKQDNYLVLETQCQGSPEQLPCPGQLRLAAFHHLAGGADGVIYDQWHSDYTGTYKGILNHDLTGGRVYRECAGIGRDFERLGQKLAGLRKQNRVAIMVSSRSMEQARWPDSIQNTCADYVEWVYDSFYKLNIEVDIIPDSQRDFTGYELLVTPCLYSAEDNLIWAIRDFVAGGGKLISTFRSFFADENGTVRADRQPYGMTDVFGMSYQEYTVPDQISLPEYDSAVEDWMELLQPHSAQVLGAYSGPCWDGISAVTCSRFGKGEAAYIGCFTPEGLEPILLRLLTSWHIPVPEISWPVVIKRGVSNEGRPIIYLLHYSAAARVIPSPAAGTELLSGQMLEEGAPLELKPWDVKILEGTI